jgi:hypothetical protein
MSDTERWWLLPKYTRKPEGALALRPHQMRSFRGLSKPVCAYCGLVALNNDATRHALRRGCWKYKDE